LQVRRRALALNPVVRGRVELPTFRFSATAPTPSIALRFDGWMLPKAGVAFVWVLEREIATASHEIGSMNP
jgi:hypothetical protein